MGGHDLRPKIFTKKNIAKVSDQIEYNFESINEDKFYFTMKSMIKAKRKSKEDSQNETKKNTLWTKRL